MHNSQPKSVFLLFAIFCDLLTSLIGVAVKYPREPYTKAEGDSLVLTCTVQFEKTQCKEIQTKWCLLLTPDRCKPLTDPQRYVIQINETLEVKNRTRKIFVRFNSLRLEDSGYYQCNAKCKSGTEAKGHLLFLNVTGGPIVSNWSGQFKTEPTFLTPSVILVLWSQF